jgi:hypothetical protein
MLKPEIPVQKSVCRHVNPEPNSMRGSPMFGLLSPERTFVPQETAGRKVVLFCRLETINSVRLL